MIRNRSLQRTYGRVAGRRVRPLAPYPRLLRRTRVAEDGVLSVPRVATNILSVLALVSVLVLSIVASLVFLSYSQIANTLNLRLEALEHRNVFETSRIYDRHGVLLYEFFGSGRRIQVDLDDISPLVVDATVAIEDKTFFTNTGVDYEGIIRALYQNVSAEEEVSGASTITQQVIKNIILTDEERQYEKRYERKLKEIILAQELNQFYSKDEILELYLNEVYYGNLAYGIEAASEVYFGTHASDVTLPQAALLSGLPQLPSKYDPINYLRHDEAGGYLPGVAFDDDDWLEPEYQLPESVTPPKWRQITVLRQMVREGYITEARGREAAAVELRFVPQEVPLHAPHFVFYARKLLEEKYGAQLVNEGGLNIYTTLDLDMQNMVRVKAAEHIASLEHRNIHNAAVVVMQPFTGQILAMVGSVDYNAVKATTTPGEEGNVLDGQVNVAIRERQPGSALKPFTYLAAMEKGMNPATVLMDLPTEFDAGDGTKYRPQNYNRRWHGSVRIRGALANSLNMPAVKAIDFAGVGYTLDVLHRVGIRQGLKRGLNHYGLSLTLGGGEVSLLELTTAYNTLASGGRYYPPNPFLEITDSQGNVLESFDFNAGEQALDPALTSIVVNMLSDDRARAPIWGMGSKLQLSRPAAVKTGTSEDWRDAWTVGFTPYVTVGVWSGNNNNERTQWVESLQGGGIIWHNVMEEFFSWIDTKPGYRRLFAEPFGGILPNDFSLHQDVVQKPVCGIGSGFGGPGYEFFTPAMLERIEQDDRSVDFICEFYRDKKHELAGAPVWQPAPQPAAPSPRALSPNSPLSEMILAPHIVRPTVEALPVGDVPPQQNLATGDGADGAAPTPAADEPVQMLPTQETAPLQRPPDSKHPVPAPTDYAEPSNEQPQPPVNPESSPSVPTQAPQPPLEQPVAPGPGQNPEQPQPVAPAGPLEPVPTESSADPPADPSPPPPAESPADPLMPPDEGQTSTSW